MNILFIHQGFPGQYGHIASALARRQGNRCVALGLSDPSTVPAIDGIEYHQYQLTRGNLDGQHPWIQDMESKVIRGEACARKLDELLANGFQPDIICGHPGWGELLFIKDLLPKIPILAYQEFYYQVEGFDSSFDPEIQAIKAWGDRARIRTKNASPLLNLDLSNWNITPTQFQRSSFPDYWQDSISVIHDGIDTDIARPSTKTKTFQLSDGSSITPEDQVITFVNRRLEPYRGCHTMIRAIPELQKLCPKAHLIIVGETTGTSYGSRCPAGEWRDFFLKEIQGSYDPSKVHFTGSIAHKGFIALMQRSNCHVYLTYPFVLSWSLLEAMACQAPVIGSDTAPVREVLKHGHNGLLVNFFDSNELAQSIQHVLSHTTIAEELGQKARDSVLKHYSLKECLPQQIELIHLVGKGAIGRHGARS